MPVIITSCNFTRTDRSNIPSEYDHYESGGIVSIEAEHFIETSGWAEKQYYTGVGITPLVKNKTRSNYVAYELTFQEKGNYNFYVLGNRERNSNSEDNCFTLSLLNEDSSLIINETIILPVLNAPVWSSISNPTHGEVKLEINDPGRYILKIVNIRAESYFLDKFVFSIDNIPMPEGTGPVENNQADSCEPRHRIVLPPEWAFGVIYGGYTNQTESLSVIDSLISGNYPIDAFWIDSYFWDFNSGIGSKGYIDFVGDTIAYPDVEAMWTLMEQKKIKAGIWVWNLIIEKGNEEVYEHFLKNNYFSDTNLNKNSWHNQSKNSYTGVIDFTNEEAEAYWKWRLKPFFDKGLDFLKLDNTSEIPFCQTAFTATQELGMETLGRGLILAHLHSTYDNRHKLYPMKWTGDAKICWSQPDYPNMDGYSMGGLKENIGMVADPRRSTYEIPFLTHDAGGYDYFGSTEQSDELFMRWIQFASMNSIMTIFSTSKNPTRNHPYRYGEDVRDNFRKYTHLRMMLFPYIYSYAINTHLTGVKIVRGDGVHEYQYLFGNEFLVAPVYRKGQTRQSVFLPAGAWYDFDTDSLYYGDQMVLVEAPVEKLPLFVRKGAIIPMRHFARAIELGNNDTLAVQIYPSEEKTGFTLYEDDGMSNDYLKGIYSATQMNVKIKNSNLVFTIDPVAGSYTGQNPDRQYELSFHDIPRPESIRLNRKRIKGNDDAINFDYSESQKILKFSFKARKSVKTSITLTF